MDSLRLKRTAKTGSAARACIECIDQRDLTGRDTQRSPLATVVDLIDRLESDPRTGGQFWKVNDREQAPSNGTSISAWPLWFSEPARNDERPLFYMTQSATSAHLSMLTSQTGQRGIILNDIESSPSRWAKGAHPWLPLWLASNRHCIPFDPASGDEARAILAGALDELYVQGAPGFCYMTLHDETGDGFERGSTQAFLGMYRLDPRSPGEQQVRLLGAGLMLREVQAAARLLQDDWGIAAEVWSCPSYTKLARDAERQSRHKRLLRAEAPKTSHLQDCLGQAQTPVIAVTGYAEFVAAQLAAHVRGPFTALGADSLDPHQRLDRHWIAITALRELANLNQVCPSLVSRALSRYRLL